MMNGLTSKVRDLWRGYSDKDVGEAAAILRVISIGQQMPGSVTWVSDRVMKAMLDVRCVRERKE